MHIPILDDYVLTTDAHNFIVNQKMTTQEGANKGKEYLLQIGFYPCLPQALEAVLTKKMLRSTRRTLNGLVSEHTELVGTIRELFPKVKQGPKLVKR